MTLLLNLSLKSLSKWINYVDNGQSNDKVRKETVMYVNKDIYLTFVLF